MRHDLPGQRAARFTAQQAAQPHPNLADQLERITPRFDELTQRARLGQDRGMPVAVLHDLEEMAQGIVRDILAPFRGVSARPVNPPRYLSADRTQAAW